jgi:hypothetical protein
MVKWKCSCGKICIGKRPLYHHIDKSHRTEVLKNFYGILKQIDAITAITNLSFNRQYVDMQKTPYEKRHTRLHYIPVRTH